MGIRYNPLVYSGFDFTGAGGGAGGAPQWREPVATVNDLPSGGDDGEARVVLDEHKIYIYDSTTSTWVDTGLTTESFGSTPNSAGYTLESTNDSGIIRTSLILQPADDTNPGGVSTSAQDIAGEKTFVDGVTLDYTTASLPVKTDASKHLISGAIDLASAETTGQLDASRIGNGDVDNTELSYVNGVTSSIQTQLNNKLQKSSGDINETLFNAANNISIAEAVTNLQFASTVRSFEALLSIQLDADVSAYEFVKLNGVNKNGSWIMYIQRYGDTTDVEFSIDASGQVYYISSSYPGFNSLEFKFRALTLND